MVSLRQVYADAKKRLCAAGLSNQNEINVLFKSAFGKSYPELLLSDNIDEKDAARFEENVARRIGGEPLQYIAGRWVFLDFELSVGEGVLIPRDETETVAIEAIRLSKQIENPVVVDLCAGTGCIAFAIKRAVPEARVTAVELYDKAFEYLAKNKNELKLDVNLLKADVFGFESDLSDSWADIIVANPPYVTNEEYEQNKEELAHEPAQALTDGGDGLSFYRHIISAYKPKLKESGYILFETGSTQTEEVERLLVEAGYRQTEILEDMYGKKRAVRAKK